MKIKPHIQPIGISIATVAVANYIAPKYTEIAAIGAGLYILYSIISYREETPSATNIRYDKTSNKVIADIKNPSDMTYAFLTQIRLREMMKLPEEGMMPGEITTERTTLIGESNMPAIIGPNEIISIECPLMIPHDMYESADGSLNIKLMFHDVQKAIEEISNKKIEQKIAHIEEKIEPIIYTPVVAKLDTTEIPPQIQTTIEPPEGIPKLPTPLEVMNSTFPEYETIISVIPENLHKAEEIIKNFKEEDLYIDSLKIISDPMNDKHLGMNIGHSQTMLQIILSLEKLKSLSINDNTAL